MRPRPTRKLALSSMSCSPPPPSHSATTTPALTRKRRASPQPAILPRVALTRRSVAPGAAGGNGSAATVPAVLERPARADRPRPHAGGGGGGGAAPPPPARGRRPGPPPAGAGPRGRP